jgi:peptidoglycan-associated lipoprotein
MKALKFANLLVIALALTVAAVGCKKKPVGVTKLPGQPAGYVGEDGGGAGLDAGGTANGSEAVPLANPANFAGMTEDRAAFAEYVVYFGFDSSLVESSENAKVVSVAGILNETSGNAVRIEGHCDERGTEGYNLALGERRALALREALMAAGVDPNRIDTISYGEERPADPGHDEIAWSKNRRGEFILLLP